MSRRISRRCKQESFSEAGALEQKSSSSQRNQLFSSALSVVSFPSESIVLEFSFIMQDQQEVQARELR